MTQSWPPKVACWCNRDIPAYSCFFKKCLLNPVPNSEPIWIVTRYGLDEGTTQEAHGMDLALPNYGFQGGGSIGTYDYLMTEVPSGTWVLTNGAIAIPKRTIFYASMPALEVCWMKYYTADEENEDDEEEDSEGLELDDGAEDIDEVDNEGTLSETEDADPSLNFFFPMNNSWSLMSSADPEQWLHNAPPGNVVFAAMFRRVGYWDEVRKLVPVVCMPRQTMYIGGWL